MMSETTKGVMLVVVLCSHELEWRLNLSDLVVSRD
jgi:hypothetical protein